MRPTSSWNNARCMSWRGTSWCLSSSESWNITKVVCPSSLVCFVTDLFLGTMFLTTNRVNTFDPAFQSRIHISLDYQELSLESRKMIWKNFLDSCAQDHSITTSQMDSLTRMNLNGRQIKNILKIARLLASRKEEKLSHEHIITTLEVTQHLHNETQFSERARGSLYH